MAISNINNGDSGSVVRAILNACINFINAIAKLTSAEINTGTDDAKFATALGLEDSKYLTQTGSKISATASGTNTYTATITPAITSYGSTQRFFIKFTNANTGTSTLNLNSLGAIAIKKNVSSALATGDILAGQIMCIAYDGTNFQVIGGGGGSATGSQSIISSSSVDWTYTCLYKTLGANTTFTFSNAADAKTIIIAITNTASNYTVTWPVAVDWGILGAPTQRVGAVTDIYTFVQINGVIYGSVRQ